MEDLQIRFWVQKQVLVIFGSIFWYDNNDKFKEFVEKLPYRLLTP